jgi:hypothetical protein
MLEETTTPGEEVKDTKVEDVKVSTETTETIGELLNEKPKAESVPLAKFLELKNENKAFQKQLKELQATIETGASKKEVSKDLKAIADEHNVDADFLQEFAQAVKAQAEAEIDDKISSKLKPLEDKERNEKIDKVFNEHFSKTMESMPEYDKIVNKGVIKTLSLDPSNANKTFSQLIEMSYGHLITGKKTMEQTQARGGKDDTGSVDYMKARKDPAYFKEVMADPSLKAKYNEEMLKRIS